MAIDLGFLLRNATSRREQWLSQKRPTESREAYIDAIGKFTKELKIVTGEANGKLFELEKFVSAVEDVFKQESKAVFTLVFHKKNSEAEARSDFKKYNPRFFELKTKYPKQMKIYWTPRRPHQHYAVIDNEAVILEEPNHVASQPFWATIINDAKISTYWENHFDTYVSHLKPMAI